MGLERESARCPPGGWSSPAGCPTNARRGRFRLPLCRNHGGGFSAGTRRHRPPGSRCAWRGCGGRGAARHVGRRRFAGSGHPVSSRRSGGCFDKGPPGAKAAAPSRRQNSKARPAPAGPRFPRARACPRTLGNGPLPPPPSAARSRGTRRRSACCLGVPGGPGRRPPAWSLNFSSPHAPLDYRTNGRPRSRRLARWTPRSAWPFLRIYPLPHRAQTGTRVVESVSKPRA